MKKQCILTEYTVLQHLSSSPHHIEPFKIDNLYVDYAKRKGERKGKGKGKDPAKGQKRGQREDAIHFGHRKCSHGGASSGGGGGHSSELTEVTEADPDGAPQPAKPKKRSKKSCHLKDEECIVIEWVEANPILWNSKNKELKQKESIGH